MRTLIILLLLSSCSAQHYLNKALKKDPSIVDTVYTVSYDTVWIDVPKVVTEFVYNYDTVTISKDSVIIRFAYDTLTRKVFIEADCPDCPEITKTERIEIPIIKEDSFWQRLSTGSKGFGLAIFMGLVLWLIKVKWPTR